MALNIIERLSLIAERLKDIADKIEGGGSGGLETRVTALEYTTQALDSQKANDDIIALPFTGSGVAGNYYIYNKELWLCVTNTSTPPSQGSSAWNHKNVGEELTRARGDIVALNENITPKKLTLTLNPDYFASGNAYAYIVGKMCFVSIRSAKLKVAPPNNSWSVFAVTGLPKCSPLLEAQYYHTWVDGNGTPIKFATSKDWSGLLFHWSSGSSLQVENNADFVLIIE